MDKASEAAAMAGSSMNANYPGWQRLKMSKQALDFYIEQWDKMEDLLTEWDDLALDTGPSGAAYESAAKQLREILDPQ